MSTDLRHALHDLAEGQGFQPDPATWDRGRRARRRSRLVNVAAALALVASLGGLGVLALDRADPIAPSDTGGSRQSLPTELHAPPERLVHHDSGGTRWIDDLVTRNLAIGRGSVAFLSGSPGSGLPVLVDAADGTHHLLELPGWVGADPASALPLSSGPGLALSPDGRHLAWAYGTAATGWEDYAPVECGIRVADLATGQVSDMDLRPLLTSGQALVAHTLVWSADGSTLGWRAAEMRQWNAAGSGTDLPARLGTVDLETGAVERVDIPAVERAGDVALAVTNGGELTVIVPDGRIWQMGSEAAVLRNRSRVAGTSVASVSPGGTQVALGSVTPALTIPFADLVDKSVDLRPIGRGVYADGVRVQPLGWVDERHVAALVTPTDDPTYASTPQVVVMTSPSVPDDEASWRIAARWDIRPDSGITVAVDLLGLGEGVPGVTGLADFPEPDWPWSDERTALTIALGLLAAALAALLVVRRARRQT